MKLSDTLVLSLCCLILGFLLGRVCEGIARGIPGTRQATACAVGYTLEQVAALDEAYTQ